MVTEDFEKLKKLNTLNREVNDLYEQISSTELYDTHLNMKFKTLGFVYALIEHRDSNFDPNGTKFLVLNIQVQDEGNMGNKNKFMLAPYCPGLTSPGDIKLTCLIVELDTINKNIL
jgi:hypothetical protein